MQCKAALKPSAEVEQVAKEDHLRECMRRWEKQRELQSNFKKQQREERLQMKTKKRCQKENIQVLKDEESFRCWILDEQIYEMKCSAAGRRDTIAKQKAEVVFQVIIAYIWNVSCVEAAQIDKKNANMSM